MNNKFDYALYLSQKAVSIKREICKNHFYSGAQTATPLTIKPTHFFKDFPTLAQNESYPGLAQKTLGMDKSTLLH